VLMGHSVKNILKTYSKGSYKKQESAGKKKRRFEKGGE